MRATLPLLICVALATTGCSRLSESRLNPFSWFDNGTAPRTAKGTLVPLVNPGDLARVVDGRRLVDRLDAVELSRTSTGAILRATGTTAGIGQFNAQLVPVSQGNGTLVFAMRAEVPSTVAQTGQTQRITVAREIPSAQLAGIRTITVQSAVGSSSIRR
jgi:hypothetical protein